MIELDDKMLRQLQMIELEMLLEVDRICKKNNIRYQIIGGTLLGAVRHGGFIPWDDDADVSMLRSEYEKFKRALKTDLDESRFYFQDFEETPGYRWSYGKLRRKGTLFVREFQEHMPYDQGVFIDIFPVDGVPDNYIFRALHDVHCFCIRKILWSEVGKIADRNAMKRAIFWILSQIPERAVLNHYKRMIRYSNRKKTRRVRFALMPLPNKGFGYMRKWFVKSKGFQFEGKCLRGTALEKEFLTYEFKNYMELPPVEKRKVHPVSEIKLIEVEI